MRLAGHADELVDEGVKSIQASARKSSWVISTSFWLLNFGFSSRS